MRAHLRPPQFQQFPISAFLLKSDTTLFLFIFLSFIYTILPSLSRSPLFLLYHILRPAQSPNTNMNSLSPDPNTLGDDINIEVVRAQIRKLEADNVAKGVHMSGRILHICHYLPVTLSYASQPGVLSPPPTPPAKAADAVPDLPINKATDKWMLTPRYGHSAMFSGIRSMSVTHQQVIVGWTGDIEQGGSKEILDKDAIPDEDKAALENVLATTASELEAEFDKPTTYIPIWLHTQDAHDHYEGYCKTSTCSFYLSTI